MARLVELRCTSCDSFLSRIRSTGMVIGSPFQECPRCGAFVERNRCREWDLFDVAAKTGYFLGSLGAWLALGLLPGLIYLLVRGRDFDPRWLALALVAGPLFAAAIPALGLAQRVRRSRARMSDPMYRAKLLEFGRRAARERASVPTLDPVKIPRSE